eukprot:TRINITY_DN9133_c0_g1_i1.p1 TRINITY_DN9133_c0_g1~~TRINITY_DN9133_c0_g1_i1.p1  ORF type:complete len:272 (-),score=86.55 TRINITY_DN9133_c0_g1_i1:17-832(-)
MFNYSIALVRDLPKSFVNCITMEKLELAIDVNLAQQQHHEYTLAIKSALPHVKEIPSDENLPDCCFVEDPVLIIGKRVILHHMKAPTRRPETEGVKKVLEELKKEVKGLEILEMRGPACADGGDILVTGSDILVGISSRTNEEGAQFIRDSFPEWNVRTVPVEKGLHLKSVLSALDETTIVIADTKQGRDLAEKHLQKLDNHYTFIFVPDVVSSNVLRINKTVLVQKGFPESLAILQPEIEKRRLKMIELTMSELIKGDGALTCCSAFIRE